MVRILASEDGGTGRATDWGVHKEIVECGSIGCSEVSCVCHWSVPAQCEVLVVCQEEDDIGLPAAAPSQQQGSQEN